MSVVSKLTIIPFPSHRTDGDITPPAYQSNRDLFRAVATGIAGMGVRDSKEKYTRLVVWCLRLLLDGWPAHIPFTNAALPRFASCWTSYATACSRSSLQPRMSGSALTMTRRASGRTSLQPQRSLPLPLTMPVLQFSTSRLHDLVAPRGQAPPLMRRHPVSPPARLPAPIPDAAEEHVHHPDTLEPVPTAPPDPESSCHPRERRQRRDVKAAHYCPVSNPMRARTVGVLTSDFVLGRPAHANHGQGMVLKPLLELRRQMVVSDHLGGYGTVEGTQDAETDGA
uniref:Mitogen-activated protein kinase (EC) n=1 Tax=Ganoderma boninense TaxID=34458 RepID=A0A5K1JSK7_9APHY|nr:Mitogen-activated protein kinase (EC [Ganoderma boninense]